MLKYRTSWDRIEAFEVERETEKMVILPAKNGQRSIRENKVSEYCRWHDTWEAAHAFLVAKAEKDVESLRMRLEQAKGKLGQIRGMKAPNAGIKAAAEGGRALTGVLEDGR